MLLKNLYCSIIIYNINKHSYVSPWKLEDVDIRSEESFIPYCAKQLLWKFVVLKRVSGSFFYPTYNARRLSRILSLAYDINFILPRAHTLISLMSCYDEEQGSELSGIRLNRVPPERRREWGLAAGGSRKIKAKYGRRAFFLRNKQ